MEPSVEPSLLHMSSLLL